MSAVFLRTLLWLCRKQASLPDTASDEAATDMKQRIHLLRPQRADPARLRLPSATFLNLNMTRWNEQRSSNLGTLTLAVNSS
ncbi:hypothetical protein PsYK624_155990 [Phanerochaete sordida]|uniref:Uncharacterized protein n=1 Tax=Phanerochaete sordida TaxID=48140 RepID=A0A9P3GTB9_9APHY|nr:hypothetical protein PsYK624_155990 [Phanerochaete sordida]